MRLSSLVIGLLVVSCMAEFEEEENVLILKNDNFDQAISTHRFVLVKFYAPWCGHCKKLAPAYAAAAEELKSIGGDNYIPLAKVDATTESIVAEKYGVKGYPTLKFFIDGNAKEYEGGRTKEEIVQWVLKKSGPPSVELKTSEDLKTQIAKQSSPLVVFFGEGEDDKDFITFKSVAQLNDQVSFYHVFDPQAKEEHNAQSKVVIFKNFDEKRNDFSGEFTQSALEQFINTRTIPILMPFNDKAIDVVFKARNNALILFTDDSEQGVAAQQAYAAVAGKYQDKLKFTFSKANDGFGLFHRLAEYLGASTTQIPNIMLFDQLGGNGKYIFSGEITSDNIDKFVEDFFNKKLQRYLKSEEIPATNDEPVKVIVSKSFDDMVINNDLDVLVEFYAPWCGHCKQLAPVYDGLAKKLQVNKKILIAKIDATANEVPQVSVESFPTLKFFKNGQKDQVIAYNGGRDEASFIQFLQENTSHPWIDLDRAEEL